MGLNCRQEHTIRISNPDLYAMRVQSDRGGRASTEASLQGAHKQSDIPLTTVED